MASCSWLLASAACFLPKTWLLWMREKDWCRDFLNDFMEESGPFVARSHWDEGCTWALVLVVKEAKAVPAPKLCLVPKAMRL